jgi:small GTP-binding protein
MDQTYLSEEAYLASGHRSGFVSVIGKPNVGKSTLMNAYLGQKVSIVSPKPQTTRRRVLGILTLDRAQVIFVDTPGIHEPFHKLGEVMVKTAMQTIPDADVLLWLVDASHAPIWCQRESERNERRPTCNWQSLPNGSTFRPPRARIGRHCWTR